MAESISTVLTLLIIFTFCGFATWLKHRRDVLKAGGFPQAEIPRYLGEMRQ